VEKWDNSRSGFPAITSPHTFHSSSASLAMLAAMRRASSFATAPTGMRPLFVAHIRAPRQPKPSLLFACRLSWRTRPERRFSSFLSS